MVNEMVRERKIIHVDMDAFYASIEQRDEPRLRGEPVIVGGSLHERGVVAAASYEARRYGVHSAMPTARALRLCRHASVIRPRMRYYREISRTIRSILRSYTALLEPLSLDEAYLDVTEAEAWHGSAEHIGREIKRRIHQATQLTCSVGVAPNKFLAKIASDLEKPNGFVVIRPDEVAGLLQDMPVSRLQGVGQATEARLRELGISTIGELREVPLNELLEVFGKWGARLFKLAHGEDYRPVTPERETKSISRETTFCRDIYDEGELLSVLMELTEEVARDLQNERVGARTVQIKVRYPNFDTITRAVTLKEPTASARLLQVIGRMLFRHRVNRGDRGVRLLGMGVSNLEDARIRQLPLFEDLELEPRGPEDLGRIIQDLRRRLTRAQASMGRVGPG